MEAGYKVRALVLPGMELNDVDVGNNNVRVITGSFDEEDKIRRVCKNASYVLCLLNDCDKTLQQSKQQQDVTTCSTNLENIMPITTINGTVTNASSTAYPNLQFMQTLLPILEDLDTCRVLLYQVSKRKRKPCSIDSHYYVYLLTLFFCSRHRHHLLH
jgi:hypothetical protein